ncbi:hypothetical protein DPMN_081536 [Dreissena polymorpha]|uniref:Uncharacterized protein n=1 Tax=Dreissena polymorpha TaxID=45954 RepID=A0A9D3Y905_DREPO|nr:hypothetical protein DPMN_081536 [Dreissena polymorpha]
MGFQTHVRDREDIQVIRRDEEITHDHPMSQRIKINWFRTKKKRLNMDIIQYYAPTNDSEDEAKKNFYNRLSTIIQDRQERSIIIHCKGRLQRQDMQRQMMVWI